MPSIVEENRMPSFSDRLMSGAARAASEGATEIPKFFGHQMLARRENEALKDLTGKDLSGLSPDIKKEFIKAQVTGKIQKQLEKENALQIGIETINKMRPLLSSAGPSNYIQGLFGGETTKNRAELASMGRSLIPLAAAGVTIRNQREFDEYTKVITNPNSQQKELEGALNGMQDLFQRSLNQSDSVQSQPTKKGKSKFNPEHPEHRAKATQLYKTYKDKARVRKELEKEFEF